MLAIQKIEFFRYIFEIYREGRKKCSDTVTVREGDPFDCRQLNNCQYFNVTLYS